MIIFVWFIAVSIQLPYRRRCETPAAFFIHIPDLAFPCVLSDFLGPGGTSYRPGRKSVLNRKFAENNFFWPET